jgi:hypothetical protein
MNADPAGEVTHEDGTVCAVRDVRPYLEWSSGAEDTHENEVKGRTQSTGARCTMAGEVSHEEVMEDPRYPDADALDKLAGLLEEAGLSIELGYDYDLWLYAPGGVMVAMPNDSSPNGLRDEAAEVRERRR